MDGWIELNWLVVLKETPAAYLVQPEDRFGDEDLPDVWLPKSQIKVNEHYPEGFVHETGNFDYIHVHAKDWLFNKNPEYPEIFQSSMSP